ncbi:MAG: 50S ribosomal protein L24 [Candidatus Niyogibacteria bacterium]|nr:50S ribosomal protein L24 [Candidatus Niyogibacteria bacterium]
MMRKIKKGDTLRVVSGKDKGKSGKALEVIRDENRVIIEGVNIHTRHQRSKKQGKKGERVHLAMPIHASNVLVVCPSCKKPARVGFQKIENVKTRICKKCKSEI